MIEKAGTIIEDMGDGPSPDRVPPFIWKLILLKALRYLNYNMRVPEWSIASDYKIEMDTMTNPFSNSYSVVIVQ
jgi:hypothetical protein